MHSYVIVYSVYAFMVLLQWMCVPFAWANEHVKPLSSQDVDWIGSVKSEEYGFYLDYGLLLILGGIPWQVTCFSFFFYYFFRCY